MDKQPFSQQNPQGFPVKTVKMPVKRPVAPVPPAPVRTVKMPVAPHPAGAPVRMVKVPVAPRPAGTPVPPTPPARPLSRPAAPAVAPAARPAPQPAVRPAPQPVSRPVSQPAPQPAPQPAVRPMTAPRPASVPPQEEPAESSAPVRKIPLPSDILAQARKLKYPEEKLVFFSFCLRMWAEKMQDQGRLHMPALRFRIPESPEELAAAHPAENEDFLEMIKDDALTLIPLMPALRRLNESSVPVGRLLDAESARLSKQRPIPVEDQLCLLLLLIKIDLQIEMCKEDKREIRRRQKKDVEAIRILEEEQKNLQRVFVKAIERKKFPVDAEKLVRNYFTFAKKEPKNAYKLLTTNPFFFSPVIMEKIPSKCFGLVKPTAADAEAINKKLASFLKNLKA